MSIDFSDWVAVTKQSGTAVAPPPVYKMVEQSAAWSQLQTWLDRELKAREQELEACTLKLQMSGDYSHEGLVRQKALIDISQSAVLLLRNIQKKVSDYANDPV